MPILHDLPDLGLTFHKIPELYDTPLTQYNYFYEHLHIVFKLQNAILSSVFTKYCTPS